MEAEKLVAELDATKAALAKVQVELAEALAKHNVRQGGVARYRSMTIEQKNIELTDLVSQTKILIEEGCYNG